MKLYNTLVKNNEKGKVQDIIFVKEGFSFFALLFGPFWFLYHKMWQEFLALILLNVALTIFASPDKFLLEISLSIIIAANANYWLCDNLRKRDYKFLGMTFGGNKTSAELRFINSLDGDFYKFDESILDPKTHRKITSLTKKLKI
jgi:hypothetical protein